MGRHSPKKECALYLASLADRISMDTLTKERVCSVPGILSRQRISMGRHSPKKEWALYTASPADRGSAWADTHQRKSGLCIRHPQQTEDQHGQTLTKERVGSVYSIPSRQRISMGRHSPKKEWALYTASPADRGSAWADTHQRKSGLCIRHPQQTEVQHG